MKKLFRSFALIFVIFLSITLSTYYNTLYLQHAQSQADSSAAQDACIVPPNEMISWWPGDGNSNDVWGQYTEIINGQVSFVNGTVDNSLTIQAEVLLQLLLTV